MSSNISSDLRVASLISDLESIGMAPDGVNRGGLWWDEWVLDIPGRATPALRVIVPTDLTRSDVDEVIDKAEEAIAAYLFVAAYATAG